ncbi:MAG: GerAB/ArcD/ProY family transporter [Clostridia bacterium]|nr:GerAB/ArcD/ProY family transporter [Clostridia bacterium]
MITKDLTSRQLTILISLSILSFKLTFFPSMLYKFASVDGFFSAILLLGLDLISFLLIFYVFFKNKDVSFSQFLEARLGKILSKFVYFLLFLFFLAKLLVLSSGGYYFARESLFESGNLFLFVFVLFVSINSVFLFKFKSFSRTVEMLFPVLLLALLSCVALGAITATNYGIAPILQTNPNGVFFAAISAYFCSGDFLFLLIFMGKCKFQNKKFNFKILIATYVLLISFLYVYFSIFRYTAFLHQHAITDIVKFVPISSVIENLDWFPTSLMLTLYILSGALYIFCLVNLLKNIFKFKRKRYDSRWLLIPINIVAITLIYFFFSNFDLLIKILQNYLNIFGVVVVWVVSILVFALSFIKKEIKNQRNQLIKINNENLKWASIVDIKNLIFKKVVVAK